MFACSLGQAVPTLICQGLMGNADALTILKLTKFSNLLNDWKTGDKELPAAHSQASTYRKTDQSLSLVKQPSQSSQQSFLDTLK